MCAKGGEPLERGWSVENLVGQERVCQARSRIAPLLHCFWLLTLSARHQPGGTDCLTLDTLLRAYPACLAFHGETGSYLALLDQVTSGRFLLRIDCGETDGRKAKKTGYAINSVGGRLPPFVGGRPGGWEEVTEACRTGKGGCTPSDVCLNLSQPSLPSDAPHEWRAPWQTNPATEQASASPKADTSRWGLRRRERRGAYKLDQLARRRPLWCCDVTKDGARGESSS